MDQQHVPHHVLLLANGDPWDERGAAESTGGGPTAGNSRRAASARGARFRGVELIARRCSPCRRRVPVYCIAYDAATGAGPCPPDPATGSAFRSIGGTSFAAPLLAGGVLIADQYARAKGGPPIGFADPLIYELGAARSRALGDVVDGDNDVLGVGCCDAGRGYDTASGWGSVNVTRFALEAQRAWRAGPAAGGR